MVSVMNSPQEMLNNAQKVQRPMAISVAGVSVSYPVGKKHRKTILEDLNLEIEEGEFVVLLGETGCGKSTLLRMLLGQERPSSGTISVAGSPVERVDARSGYVPQKYSLFPDRTVLDNLTMGPETSRYHILGRLKPSFRAFRRQAREEALKQLQHMGLQASDGDKYPSPALWRHAAAGGDRASPHDEVARSFDGRGLQCSGSRHTRQPAASSTLCMERTQTNRSFVTHNTAEALFLGTRLIVLARASHGDTCGSRVALDMKLPESQVSLNRNAKEFMDLVDYVESFSLGVSHETTSPIGETI